MDADSGQGATALGTFGAILAGLVVIEVLAWLWAQTIGAGFGWSVLTLLVGVALVVAWLAYLVTWAFRRKRFAWHLLIIPTIGLLGLGAAFSGLPQKARWAYDEPRLTVAAREAIADPRAEFHDQNDRTIGTQEVSSTSKVDGVVTFRLFSSDGFFSMTTLQYRPDGSSPDRCGTNRCQSLSDGWWRVLVD
ncbi:hypothetical protein [Tsukamurella pseudospumae]|nr:hypothetical protein [Tsukamurella pseudospumae]KXP00014.1 hypothetical protein AXK61_15520 [Tsukamurella pseudospumae]